MKELKELIEITEEDVLHPKITVKERMLALAGHPVNQDTFFFRCLEEEKTLGATNPNLFEHPHCPAIKDLGQASEAEFGKWLVSLCDFYQSEYEALSAPGVIDRQQIAAVVPPFVLFLRDFRRLACACFNENIPPYLTDDPGPFWSTVAETLKRHFASHSELFLSYLYWLWQAPNREVLDLKSIPPEGRYAHLLFKLRNEKFPMRPSDRGRRPSPGSDRGGPPPRGGNDRRPGGRDRPPNRKFDNDKGSGGPRDRKERKPRDDKARQEREKLAINEISQAITQLKDNANLGDITLQPQNSFLRRIQHKEVIKLGYISESVGEGHDRAVKIMRPGAEGSTNQ